MKLRLPLFTIALALFLTSCAQHDRDTMIRISVPNQKMIVFKKNVQVAMYDCSTSKFGLGDQPGSNRTPLGRMMIAQKIGGGQPSGMKFKSRRPTGEIVKPDAPGRDPIVSRILWLKGLERQNARAFGRTIYIHGTAEERTVGTPASYGCIRMRSRDVIRLYNQVGIGARVEISPHPFPAPLVATALPAPAPASTPTRQVSTFPDQSVAKPAAIGTAAGRTDPRPG